MSLGAKLLKGMSDAVAAYNHYHSGTGTDLKIDYEKAYNQDSIIKSYIDKLIKITQSQVEVLQIGSGKTHFSITSDLYSIPNGSKENWQKTIGAHYVWVSGTVIYKNGEYAINITIHMKDRYNFNKGMVDIASNTPDDVNGRFAVLGWAKSFFTIGELHRTVIWGRDSVEGTLPNQNKNKKR